METILIIFGILGVGVLSILTWVKKLIFKHNIEFHEILQSFPLISEHRLNDGTKTVVNDGTKTVVNAFSNIPTTQISKEFTEFAESKRGDIDEFLAKIEKFDTSKLRFKKKEITSFINNIKRLLISKSSNITIKGTLDLNSKEFSTEMEGNTFEWTAFNYVLVDKIMKNQENIDKLFFCKILKF